MAKYRKIDTRIWNDEKFQQLEPMDKYLAIYCLTAQCNRIGIFKFSIALAAEDMGMVPETLREGLARVCETLNWSFDEARRVLYFPRWWKYNAPESRNVMIGCLKDLHDVPETHLIRDFLLNREFLGETLAETLPEPSPNLPEGFRKPYPKPSPIQEQEQEQEQEQVINASAFNSPEQSSELDHGVGSDFVFPLVSGTYRLPQEKVKEYREAHTFDVEAELRKIALWLKDNKQKRNRGSTGLRKRITAWLNRAADDHAKLVHRKPENAFDRLAEKYANGQPEKSSIVAGSVLCIRDRAEGG